MTDDTGLNPALLPTGLADLLPPEAEAEAVAVGRLMKVFHSHGYQRVKPPLLEFADGLLTGTGAAMGEQTFRLMDPDTHRMLGLRADMTPQVARIAGTRLAGRPRPLRLSYAGQCLLVRGSQVDPNRQVAQAGIELIGPDTPTADAEMVLLAAEALESLGLSRISIDLTMPTLAPALLDEAGITGAARKALTHALDRKDSAVVAQHGGVLAGLLTELLLAAGPVGPAMDVLERARLGAGAAAMRDRLRAVVAAVRGRAPGLRLTLDPLEFRGFRYHTGICMTVFSHGRAVELGRGGRYLSGEEPATGLSLFPDAILRVCPALPVRPRVFLPWPAADDASPEAVGEAAGDASAEAGARLRGEGYATIGALAPSDDPVAEAARLGCTHVLRDGAAVPLHPES